jgi:nucleoid DNA-binding protein
MSENTFRDLTRQDLEREIARRSKFEKYPLTEEQVHEVLGLFFDIMFDTLTQINGNVTLVELGYFEAWRKREGGKVKAGHSKQDLTISHSYQIRFRPASRLKQALKERGRSVEIALRQQEEINKTSNGKRGSPNS